MILEWAVVKYRWRASHAEAPTTAAYELHNFLSPVCDIVGACWKRARVNPGHNRMYDEGHAKKALSHKDSAFWAKLQ